MDQSSPSKKVFHTALIIAPPASLIEPIQKIRKEHDKAYDRWMPHVNLAFPFFDPVDFGVAHAKLQEHFKSFESFDLTLGEFEYFDHGKNCVMWLRPEADGAVQQVFAEIQKAFPQLNDLASKGENGYTPHLTCGQFSKNIIKRVRDQYQASWQPIKFHVQQLHLIQRDGQNSPFYVARSVKYLKSDKPIPAGETNYTFVPSEDRDLEF